ncbi:MAG: flagellar FliJ family protein [Pseudomonadota bacterium]|nr:flagellar FliJ family protein [Pseudomonadota bacterium]
MKSLATLIKLQKTRVDDQRLALAKLQARLEEMENAITSLEIAKAREQLIAQEHAEARATYGAFLNAAVRQGRDLEKQRLAAARAVDEARQRLAELFEEQKRYEIADAARLEAEQREEHRRETLELDEIGSVSHVRKNS